MWIPIGIASIRPRKAIKLFVQQWTLSLGYTWVFVLGEQLMTAFVLYVIDGRYLYRKSNRYAKYVGR